MEGSARVVAYGAEGVPMLEPKIVRQIEELSVEGWGSRRIANELGVARNTVRRYLRGGEAAQQQVRPRARRLDAAARRQAIGLFEGTAQGNAVVVRELLAAQGLRVSLRTIQRVVECTSAELFGSEMAFAKRRFLASA